MIFSRMSSWASFMVLILCFSFNHVSEASHRKLLHSSAIVVGSVYCDTCFHQHFSKSSHFISGALVAVECGGEGGLKPSFREEVKTNEKGEFRVQLPFSVSKHVDKIKGCAVKLVRSNEPYCAVASTATSSSIRLQSKKRGTHIFSAGFFTFKPLKQPELCNQKPGIMDSKELGSVKVAFPPSLPGPPTPFLPLVGEVILPPLPVPHLSLSPLVSPLPRLPGIGIPPVTGIPIPPVTDIPLPPIARKKTTTSESSDLSNEKIFGFPFPLNPLNPPSLFSPLPFQPSPSLLPPLPFQPSPPSLIPPLIPSPPPASLFPPLTPLPGILSSPPPPSPPAFLIPLPPLPKLPPGFPGIPPASSSP